MVLQGSHGYPRFSFNRLKNPIYYLSKVAQLVIWRGGIQTQICSSRNCPLIRFLAAYSSLSGFSPTSDHKGRASPGCHCLQETPHRFSLREKSANPTGFYVFNVTLTFQFDPGGIGCPGEAKTCHLFPLPPSSRLEITLTFPEKVESLRGPS